MSDTVLHDIKLTDPERHKKWCGADNTRIRANLKRAYETFPIKTFIGRTRSSRVSTMMKNTFGQHWRSLTIQERG